MKSVVFREPRAGDVGALVRLMEQLGYSIGLEAMERNIRNFSSGEREKAWVAVEGEEVVGCVAVAITGCFHEGAPFLRLITLVVDERFRRVGVGRQLVEVAEEYARKMGCSQVELTSGVHRAAGGVHDFYKSLGYFELNELKKYFVKKI